MHSSIGLTVSQGDVLGLVLDYDGSQYTVDFEDGRLAKTANLTWVPDIEQDADTAMYRRWNRTERLAFTEQGWDVESTEHSDYFEHTQDPNDEPLLEQGDPMWGLAPSKMYVPASPETEDGTYPQEGLDPFPKTVPLPMPSEYDSDFPSMTSHVTGMEPNLDSCPECHDPMTISPENELAFCASCGHRQPISYLAAKAALKKHALGPELLENLVSTGEGEGNVLGMADDLLGGAMNGAKKHDQQQDAGGSAGAAKDMQNFQVMGASDDELDKSNVTENSGRDVIEDASNEGFTKDEGDTPDLLKDVSGEGGSDYPSHTHAIELLMPYLQKAHDSDQSGADDPILLAIKEVVEKHKSGDDKEPEGAEHSPEAQEGEPSELGGDEDKEHEVRAASVFERLAARRPKMCPFHGDLTELALELGDPTAAVSGMSRHMYGPNSCKGQWDQDRNHKCRYKAPMLKQEYWDQKDAQAEERKRLREEQTLQQPVQQVAPDAEPIAEDQVSAVGEPTDAPTEQFVQTPVPADNAIQAPGDYIAQPQPKEQAQPANVVQFPQQDGSYVAPAVGVAAKVATAAIDVDGDPIHKGATYEVMQQGQHDIIPDVVTINNVTPETVEFTVHGAHGIEFQDSTPVHDIGQGLMFRKHQPQPNAHGLALDQESHDSDEDMYTGPGPNDLDSGENSRAYTAKEAGYNYGQQEQREFINEGGVARNLDKLDLTDTHYIDGDDRNVADELLWY
jgi:hypothetical protein